ncbi:carbohydrate sulfotransferase 8-like [Mya arenaria]|uniref:carbohydrate sulfotransferase 8-like n=1 Tax=Mya arenaria TaxID=6604 RepID=UPI0022E54463|nr:carbohydrate sulfotransferase 8-like [Mya arenaria]
MGTPQNKKFLVGNFLGREWFDKHHRILFCGIAKVSSSFWKQVLTVLGKSETYSSPFEVKGARSVGVLSRIQQYTELNDMDNASEFNLTTAFMFVRNPYARLYSGYVDKLYTPIPGMFQVIGREAALTVRNCSKDFEYAYDITFREFVQYILQLYKDNKYIDGHFKPMTEKCDACAIPYTFIGHLETLEDDAKYLMSKWRQMRQLREYLLKDYTMFGYDDKPKELFDRKTLIVDHVYLDGL